MRTTRVLAIAISSLLSACGGGRGNDDEGSVFTEGGPGGDGDGTGSGDADADGTGDGDASTSTGDGTEEGGVFDVGNDSTGATAEGGCDPNNDPECSGCTAVDIVFVIDNSVSMNDYQVALGLAFPAFADAIVSALPPGTDVHVGVTSTEMGYSSAGSTSNCMATGDNGQPASAFYITPEQQNTGKNGAQGRLYQYGGKSYVAFDTDDAQAVQAAKDWFGGASNIGEGGSQVEMSAAGAGWVFSDANDATNAGFVRDQGAVLVVFVLQDEPDQTPGAATQEIIDLIAGAKVGCGGMDCVIGGGFVNQFCLDQTPLGALFGAFGAPAVEQDLPDENLAEDDPQAAADMMTGLLEDTLAQVIAQKCDEIPPEG